MAWVDAASTASIKKRKEGARNNTGPIKSMQPRKKVLLYIPFNKLLKSSLDRNYMRKIQRWRCPSE